MALHHAAGSRPFRRAIAAGNPAAVRAAIIRFFRDSRFHIVRVRAWRGSHLITDVGTTYKLCRREALIPLMSQLKPGVNLEFNAHFLDTALDLGCDIVECPITFHPRVGVSKGGNVNNRRALYVGLGMLFGIVWGWRAAAA